MSRPRRKVREFVGRVACEVMDDPGLVGEDA